MTKIKRHTAWQTYTYRVITNHFKTYIKNIKRFLSLHLQIRGRGKIVAHLNSRLTVLSFRLPQHRMVFSEERLDGFMTGGHGQHQGIYTWGKHIYGLCSLDLRVKRNQRPLHSHHVES